MPSLPKPRFQYAVKVNAEVNRLRQHKQTRAIPDKAQNRLLLATWNIANFGEQAREDPHHQLIAEILSWFDITAIQETKDNFGPLDDVVRKLGAQFKYVMSDASGNKERMVFVYDSQKVKLLEKIGEIALPPADLTNINLPGIKQEFKGFDRTPYLATFQSGKFSFLLANVHLFFGTDSGKKDIERRTLETFAVARWAEQREGSPYSFTRDIIALGDFNMPKAAPTDPIFKALMKKGLHLPQHTSQMGSTLAVDKHYDQIAFFPGETQADFTGSHGVFDYDQVTFPDLWQGQGKTWPAGKQPKKENAKGDFNTFLKYFISDHRPMWMEFRTQ